MFAVKLPDGLEGPVLEDCPNDYAVRRSSTVNITIDLESAKKC